MHLNLKKRKSLYRSLQPHVYQELRNSLIKWARQRFHGDCCRIALLEHKAGSVIVQPLSLTSSKDVIGNNGSVSVEKIQDVMEGTRDRIYSDKCEEECALPDSCFDIVFADDVLEHIRWNRWLIQEIHRITKPCGFVILCVPNLTGIENWLNPVWLYSLAEQLIRRGTTIARSKITVRKRKKSPVKGKIDGISHELPVVRFYSPGTLRKELKTLEFEIIGSMSLCNLFFGRLPGQKRIVKKISLFFGKADEISEEVKRAYVFEKGGCYTLFCRKRKNAIRLVERAIFSGFASRIRDFEKKQKKLIKDLNIWIRKMHFEEACDSRSIEKDLDVSNTALVLSPHPDDEIIGCGGTILKMRQKNLDITVLQMTDGSDTVAVRGCPESLRVAVRIRESMSAARQLGIAELILWKERQSEFNKSDANIRKLSDLLQHLRPDIIFVPFINDAHRDHITANQLLKASLHTSGMDLSRVVVFSYEVWSLVPPNRYCIIDDLFDEKIRAMLTYRTALKAFDYIHYCKFLNAYHSHILFKKKGFTEVFYRQNASGYLVLT
jgi:LmbE family N-acetylglucosaminyl deacetylase/SAM-dependent methyltransferase